MARGTPEPAFSGGGHADGGMGMEEGGAGHFSLFSGFQMYRKHTNLRVSRMKEYCGVGCCPFAGPREVLWSPWLCLSWYCLTCAAHALGGGTGIALKAR